jgi:hypothetical protein
MPALWTAFIKFKYVVYQHTGMYYIPLDNLAALEPRGH